MKSNPGRGRRFFRLPFPPSTNAIWEVARGRIIKSKAAREYNELVAFALIGKREPAIGDPVAIELEFFYPTRPKRKRDLDNRIKPLLDALTAAGVWVDDSQVVYIKAAISPVADAQGGSVHVRLEVVDDEGVC